MLAVHLPLQLTAAWPLNTKKKGKLDIIFLSQPPERWQE